VSNHLRATSAPAPEFILQLRAARLDAGLSQHTLGEGTGWDQARVHRYEQGHRAMTPATLEQWAQAVGRTITTEPAEAHCRVCKCTEDNPCDGGCAWVGDEANTLAIDLCTTCAWVIARDAIASGLYQLQETNGDTPFEARGGLIPQPNLTEAEIDQLQPILDDIEAAGQNLDRIAETAQRRGFHFHLPPLLRSASGQPAEQVEQAPASGFPTDNEALSGTTTSTDEAAS
jgi:transcriptional regulator with XRE-family HTH domain